MPRLAPAVFVAPEASASRFVVVLDSQPTEHAAIEQLDGDRGGAARHARRGRRARRARALAGDTAIASASVDAMRTELIRVGVAALIVNFLLLALFLRALVAPLYLLAANALTVAATLGITTWFFQDPSTRASSSTTSPSPPRCCCWRWARTTTSTSSGGIWRAARRVGIVEGIRTAMPAASLEHLGGRARPGRQLRPAGDRADRCPAPVRLRHGARRRRSTPSSCGPSWCPPLITLVGRRGFWPGSAPRRRPSRLRLAPAPSGPASAPGAPR